ncbi:putative MFS family arabinose efflux permease [Tumebacillus sp. BK434]|uniref:MFS transporter n=1 Tax=Tumebacillus sp. BK434 TaxID=2512169 RepID=UPI00104BF7DF|nr:MFS transporter [Tumebacillus sp. BK434]TCP55888.1 putative MFS family arabinose efflux permease [Tumebacillus sp. BK434]
MTTAVQTPDHKKVFRHLYQLTAGKTISDIGNNFDMVALNMFVYLLTDSAVYMGLFMAVRLAGAFVAGFYAGILADRMNRKHLMILSDFGRSAALLAIVLTPTDYQFYVLIPLTFIMGCLSTLFGVCLQSSIPAIVGKENIVKANAVLTAWGSVAMVIGLFGAGMLLGKVSYETVFLIDACTYVLSALNLLSIPLRTNEERAVGATKEKNMSFFAEFKLIYVYLRTVPILLSLMAIRLIDTFGSAAHNVGMPIFSSQLRPDQPSFYMGIIWGVWGIGNLIGSRIMAKKFTGNDTSINERAFGIATFFMSLFFILLFFESPIYIILLFAALAGIADGVSAIVYATRLQQTPDEKRGRMFGVSTTLQTVGFAVGMVICSPLFEIFKPVAVVGMLHGLPMIMALLFTLYYFGKWKLNRTVKTENSHDVA